MSEHLQAGYRELTPTRRSERNGHYTRNLLTPAGKVERLEVPRDREGEFVTELFERYKRMTGDVEEANLKMYLSGISTRKVAGITDAFGALHINRCCRKSYQAVYVEGFGFGYTPLRGIGATWGAYYQVRGNDNGYRAG